MSGVTGEIAYKVDASGKARPEVGVRSVNGTLVITGALTINGTSPPIGFANPGNKVSTAGTSGTATTAMRSDAAPAVDQAMAPTWTGQHTFTPSSFNGPGILVQSAQGGFGLKVVPVGGSPPFFGAQIAVGNGGTDTALSVNSNAGAGLAILLRVPGDGSTILAVQQGNTSTKVLGIGTSGPGVVLGTSTLYTWGTGTNYPILQFAGLGSIFGTATNGLVLTGGGLFWSGTNYVYGQAGTGIVAALGTGSFIVQCVSTSGTATSTGTLTTVFSIGGTVTSNKIQGYGPNAAALVDMTPDTGSFVATLTGCTTSPTGTCYWARNGNIVVLALPASLTGTSNANTMTLTGLPAGLTPTRTQFFALPEDFMENGGALVNTAAGSVGSDGSLVFYLGGNNAGWGTTLIKGFGGAAVSAISYLLN